MTQSSRYALVGLIALALVLSSLPLSAQNASASLSATVTDITGARIPNAKVILKNEATNVTRESVTNGSGFVAIVGIQPGSYTVTVSSPGLQSWEQRNIVFTQGSILTLPTIALQVQGQKQEVMVMSAADAVVPVDSGTASQTLNKSMVEDLSIVGRDAAELIKIMPGMGMTGGLNQSMWNSYTTQTNDGPIGKFSAAGTQPYGAVSMTSDGASLLDPGNQGTQTANINQNQVAEVSILTSAFGAEFAKGPVTFQAIGKSGGAQFHGSGYFYARNGVMNSNDAFNKANGLKAPQDSYYYPGGDFGGPVLIPGTGFNKNRDKLFFYTAFEYMKQQPSGNLTSRFLPTQEMMVNGNFSEAYMGKTDANGKCIEGSGVLGCKWWNAYGADHTTPNSTMAPGGMIPKSTLDPNSLIYWKTYPGANVNPATSASGANYQVFLGPPQNRWEYRIRADYNISQNTKLFFSYNRQSEKISNPISVWWAEAASLPYPATQNATQKANVYSANLVHVFSPSLTNEVVFGMAKFLNPIILGNKDSVNPDKLGFKMTGLFSNPFTPQIPNVFAWDNTVPGYFTPNYGTKWSSGGADSFGKMSMAPNISDNVTKVAGTHTIKAGFYFDFAQNQQTSGGYQSGATQGAAIFTNYGSNTSGNPLADFAMARVTQFWQSADAPIADFKYYQYSFYVSDQWKAHKRLTLTFGARFEHMGQWVPNNPFGLAVWDSSLYDNTSAAKDWTGLTWNARDKSIPKSGFPSKPFFFEPRIGAAYDIFGTGRTVIRGGFGVYRYQLAYNSVSAGAYNAPLDVAQYATTWNCCIGWTSFNQFSPGSSTKGIGQDLSGILTKGDDKTPYTQTYNITVSQRAPWHSVFEVQYQGNRSRDMMLRGGLSDINLIPLGTFFKADPTDGLIHCVPGRATVCDSSFDANRYYARKNYHQIQLITHGSYSNYNSMIMSWQKQTGRATFTTNYTFGKALGIRDNQTDNGVGQGNTNDPFSMKSNYGVLAFDHSHIFNAAYVISLPNFTKGNKIAGGITNGWVLSGITQVQSGAPIQPNANGDLNASWPGSYSPQNYLGSNAPNLKVMPRLTCDPRKGVSDGQYFNPSCFAPPVGGANGDIVWPYIKGPKFFNSDLAIYKDFKFKESQKISFRFSMFNFLNHALPTLNPNNNDTNAIKLNFNNNDTLAQTNQNALTTGKANFTQGRRLLEFSVRYSF